MRLLSLKYQEFPGLPAAWTLDEIQFGARNLLVGKNATGKTRVLNVIGVLGQLLSGGAFNLASAEFDATFDDEGKSCVYHLAIKDKTVASERYTVNGVVMLDRKEPGDSSIFAEEVSAGGVMMKFKAPPTEIAAVVRRDAIQHPFLEVLHRWGAAVRQYRFGSPLGKDNYAVFIKKAGPSFDERDPDAILPLFRQCVRNYGALFEAEIVKDMAEIGYNIESVTLGSPVSIKLENMDQDAVSVLLVKERELSAVIDQTGMSQGMFRAMAILIHVNSAKFAKANSCILIDDIGEGLDFDRSTRLIEWLRRRSIEEGLQLIMTTNDRFVMNKVPLEEWSVLIREAAHVRAVNQRTAPALFEDFKFSGLSNFSFLEMGFASGVKQEHDDA